MNERKSTLMKFPIPRNEADRLAYLESLQIPTSQTIPEIQGLCDLVAELTNSDIALVSMIEKDEQRFAAIHGLDGLHGTPREHAFCTHAIMNTGQFIVEDAARDARFANNPLVTGAPNIAAYAGTVLEPEPDMRIGTICVINKTPRVYSSEELSILERIGNAVAALLSTYRHRVRLVNALKSAEEAQHQLQKAALYDGLTGLYNHSAFGRICEEMTAKSQGNSYLAIVDVDEFKSINDRHGHYFGDRFLKAFATALQTALPAEAAVGRLGGDEFGIFLETREPDLDRFLSLLKTCERSVNDACLELGGHIAGRASFGVSVMPDHGRTYEQMFQHADVALYASKQKGRNRITVFSEEINRQFNTLALRKNFDEACANGLIVPYFQPIVDIASGETLFYEMLCRWNHPTRGLLPPSEFLRLFDDHLCAPKITLTLAAQIRMEEVRAAVGGLAPRVTINVTAHDLHHPLFFEKVEATFPISGLKWSDVVFEITENLVLDAPSRQLHDRILEIRSRGAKIALDDFGTGHSGFQHLKAWPVDIVKIDKSFTKNICFDVRDRAIVKTIVELSQYLGKFTIAEGVEELGQLDVLREIGCDAAQGFLFGRPRPEIVPGMAGETAWTRPRRAGS